MGPMRRGPTVTSSESALRQIRSDPTSISHIYHQPSHLSTTLKFGEICLVLFVFESGIVRFLVQDADVVNLQLKRSVISIHHGKTNGIYLFPEGKQGAKWAEIFLVISELVLILYIL